MLTNWHFPVIGVNPNRGKPGTISSGSISWRMAMVISLYQGKQKWAYPGYFRTAGYFKKFTGPENRKCLKKEKQEHGQGDRGTRWEECINHTLVRPPVRHSRRPQGVTRKYQCTYLLCPQKCQGDRGTARKIRINGAWSENRFLLQRSQTADGACTQARRRTWKRDARCALATSEIPGNAVYRIIADAAYI